MSADAPLFQLTHKRDSWLDKPVLPFWPAFSVEKLIIIILILLTITSRFYDLGARVMSHDEVNHVVPAYDFYQGRGYRYDPVTHGPFQFHMIALSYFMFGDSDFSARIPAAVFGIAIVLFTIFAWRRYLGRIGALIGGALFAISPYMLFYSRYTRNEIFIVFWGLVLLWTILRYLECGEKKYLIILTVITALHFTDKATSFIFTAEALIFLGLFFIWELIRQQWQQNSLKMIFLVLVVIALIGGVVGLFTFMSHPETAEGASETPVVHLIAGINAKIFTFAGFGVALIAASAAIILLLKNLKMHEIRGLRSFDLIALQLTLILPLLAALPVKLFGFNPLDYTQTGIIRSALVVVPLLILSVFLGLAWNRQVWTKAAVIFWSIFIIFYTSIFTQGDGFFAGIMGALGYWMSQQSVQRGSQPLYYYAFLQVPIYEYLPALGTALALSIGVAKKLFISKPGKPFEPELFENDVKIEDAFVPMETEFPEEQTEPLEMQNYGDNSDELDESEVEFDVPRKPLLDRLFPLPPDNQGELRPIPTLAFLLFWSLISMIAFSLAGERMPWLTTHVTLPLILSAAWGLGFLVETSDWQSFFKKKGLLVFGLLLVFLVALSNALGTLLGENPPFSGKELPQLEATSTFLLGLLAALASAAGLVILLKEWRLQHFIKSLLITFFLLLGVLTFRTAYRAAYINYDNAKEYLVYAHATRDMKDVLEQVETISKRLFGDKSIIVAYDNDSLYPFWWYFRDYPNKRWYGDTPSKDLRNAPVILAGSQNYAKIEPVVANDYYVYNYKRMWWPMEDYRNQTLQTVWEMLKDPAMRSALWQIWFNRDYTKYAEVTGKSTLTLATWSPSDSLSMYIKKDIAAQIWEYGLTPEPEEPKIDPYLNGTISLEPDKIISGVNETLFQAPRGIAFAPDSSLYLADSRNHRIVHLDAEGSFINAWGTYANVLDGNASPGTFNEPWGVAVSPQGSVYVADTWNHRIQKFNADGALITMWDTFGSSEAPDAFWGPRGIAVDSLGRVYVTDTGKQRVVIFDSNGQYITQFGGLGLSVGQLDEPVGIAVDDQGLVYVADTWNNRIQIFFPSQDGLVYSSLAHWEVSAWTTQSLDNKPFLAINSDKQIFITDPDLGRIIRFDDQGNFLQLWGGYENDYLIGIASGIAVDLQGKVWITDALNNTLLRFDPPVPDLSLLPINPLPTTGD